MSLWAQSPAPLRADRAGEAVSPDHALAAWRDAHGQAWQASNNRLTGTLELLFGGNAALLAENDDWSASEDTALIAAATTQVGAFPLPNPSKDAALLRTVDVPGGYTHHLAGAPSGTGVALVEVYEIR